MAWSWVGDLFAPDAKKHDFNWNARCPYYMCPSNRPFDGAHPARLKLMQSVGILTRQYKCKDCGNLVNIDISVPDERGITEKNPLFYGGARV